MRITGGAVGLAEWIIDDTHFLCLVLLLPIERTAASKSREIGKRGIHKLKGSPSQGLMGLKILKKYIIDHNLRAHKFGKLGLIVNPKTL